MQVTLDSRCRSRLVEELTTALQSVRVEHAQHIDLRTWGGLDSLDRILPDRGDVRPRLESAVGEDPVSSFVKTELFQDVQRAAPYDGDAEPRMLSQVPGFEDLGASAELLITRLVSLPWQYRLCVRTAIPVADFPGLARGAIPFGERVRLQTADEDFQRSTPFGGPSRLPLGEDPPQEYAREWEPSAFYLVQEVEGYIPELIETATLESSETQLKSCLGLGISVALFITDWAYFGPYTGEEVLVFRVNGGSVERRPSRRLSADTSRFLRGLRLSELARDSRFAPVVMEQIRRALTNDQSGNRLQLAASWFFDSFAGQNELLAFVQAVVCSEILLGFDKTGSDFGEVGMTELLANRCAYLIARTQQDRSMILCDFKRIYKTRSDIVHRGKQRLSRAEMEDLHRMRSLCGQVIRKELQLMSPDAGEKVI